MSVSNKDRPDQLKIIYKHYMKCENADCRICAEFSRVIVGLTRTAWQYDKEHSQ